MRGLLLVSPLAVVVVLVSCLLVSWSGVADAGPGVRGDVRVEGEGDEPGPGGFLDPDGPLTQPEVDRAIDRGQRWLLTRQRDDGSWEPIRGNRTYDGRESAGGVAHRAGPTALALYTLLKCEAALDRAPIQRGFAYLDGLNGPFSSYELSAMLLAVTATGDPKKAAKGGRVRLPTRFARKARELVRDLVSQRAEGARGWRYNVRGQPTAPGGPEDLSSTQLAALALLAAHRSGIVPPRHRAVWEDVLSFSLAQQEVAGPKVQVPDPVDPSRTSEHQARGFAYLLGRPDPDEGRATGGMTACGVANLAMARYVLTGEHSTRGWQRWSGREDAATVEAGIADGLAWINANWSAFENPGKTRMNVYHLYWCYALERAMDLLDRRLVGKHLWYGEMGRQIVDRQYDAGHWNTNSTHAPREVLDTCFALLFLRRATRETIPSVTDGGGAPQDHR